MTKKIPLTLTIIFLCGVMLWGFLGWFVAKESEQQLRTFLKENFHHAELNSIDAELLRYKPSFAGAKASVKVSSKVEFIREQIGELFLTATLLNGPVFYDDGNILFGKALWKISLDKSISTEHLSDNSQAKIRGLFKSNVPFLSILTGFDNSLSYQSHIRDLSSPSIHIENIISVGEIDKSTHSNHLNILLHDVSLLTETGVVEIPKLEVAINIDKQPFLSQKQISYSTQPFIFRSSIKNEDKTTLSSNGIFTYFNNKLSGSIKLNSYFKNEAREASGLAIELHSLSVAGYQAFLQAEAQILNLKHQVQWTLEENAETPEGQDHIWQLYDQIKNKRELITKIISQQVFSDSASKLKFSLDLVAGTHLFPPLFEKPLLKKLVLLSEKGLINQINNHYQTVIESKESHLLINDNSMTWDDFIKNFRSVGTKLEN